MNRKKFITIYLIFFFILSFSIYFGLKAFSRKNFSLDKFKTLTDTNSVTKDKTGDLCKYQILGEPKVENQYIKINFWCQNQTKARSTLALTAISDLTVEGVLKEYARIINFDYNLIHEKQWYCLINDREISITNITKTVDPGSTIDCFENKNLKRHD